MKDDRRRHAPGARGAKATIPPTEHRLLRRHSPSAEVSSTGEKSMSALETQEIPASAIGKYGERGPATVFYCQ